MRTVLKKTTTIRMDEETRSLIDIGIRYTRQSQTAFIRNAIREKVSRLAEENAANVKALTNFAPLVLTEAESKRFCQILEQDFEPTKALLELTQKRRHNIVERV